MSWQPHSRFTVMVPGGSEEELRGGTQWRNSVEELRWRNSGGGTQEVEGAGSRKIIPYRAGAYSTHNVYVYLIFLYMNEHD